MSTFNNILGGVEALCVGYFLRAGDPRALSKGPRCAS